uniref:CUB domain-containing protein n=1 Tax=Fundulus heteroclitus TaxID=8078 RepID=A0A3Q2P8N9_FUNHE
MTVTIGPTSTVVLSRDLGQSECEVCVPGGTSPDCSSTVKTLKSAEKLPLEFSCMKPQDVFKCTKSSCTPAGAEVDPELFKDFKKTMTWDISVPEMTTLTLDFPKDGLKEISASENCDDDFLYTVKHATSDGQMKTSSYCKGGTVSKLDLFGWDKTFTLLLLFDNGLRRVKRLELIRIVIFPSVFEVRGKVRVGRIKNVTPSYLLTPNYPRDFPDQQQMQWEFTIPSKHNYTVNFLKHSAPECLNGDVVVEYQKEDTKVTKLTLTDPQPREEQGSFKLVLKNCETNSTLTGLSLSYRVSLKRSGIPGKSWGNLQSYLVETSTTAKLSFLDCPDDGFNLTCENVTSCPSTSLSVPTLDSCLLMPLQSVTWKVIIPTEAKLDLVSPTGSLRQSLPGLECDQSSSLHLASDEGFSIGDFCSDGVIQSIQVPTGVSVTATERDFSKSSMPLLNFTVSPKSTGKTIIYFTQCFIFICLDLNCVFICSCRKKKSKIRSQASIYMGQGNIFRPNDQHFTKVRSDNDSHVYDSIDETMVYGHLLTNSIYNDSVQSPKTNHEESYKTFVGHIDRTVPVINEPDPEEGKGHYTLLDPSDALFQPRPRTPVLRQESLGFEDRRMQDNELHTFKSKGDINTIRLSAIDLEPEPEPPVLEENF